MEKLQLQQQSLDFKVTKIAVSGPLSVRLWAGDIFSSFNENNVFKPCSFLEHLVEPKVD